MDSLSERLNCRVALYSRQETKNELGELDFNYTEFKKLWAEIKPQGGDEKAGQGNTVVAEISHKFVIRANAIPGLANDMYFLFKGQRYDILYFNPNYKHRDSVEVFCKLVVESDG